MVFSSTIFIFFFLPIFLLLDFILKSSLRNLLIIFSSILFYTWGEGNGIILLCLLSVFNLAVGKILFSTRITQNKFQINVSKLILFIGIFINLTILFYYKYLFWFLKDILPFLHFELLQNITLKHHALPLGISFFTFHAISYLVDIYRGVIKEHSNEDFLTYFFMFPHLVAGPIVRFEGVREDIQKRRKERQGRIFSTPLFSYGVFRFILGVNKKVLIANSVAPLVDIAFASSNPTLGTFEAWIGAIAYTIQIYFDFSGYSDMAIGLAAMMGIHFNENFNSPYKSSSIKEFWRRWHISLSSWLKDYLYIPLGGSRCNQILTYRNLFIVFILCGLWHGAQFTFLVWGLFHGLLLILERTKFDSILANFPTSLKRCYCLVMVIIGWVFFRAESLPQAFSYLNCMFSVSYATQSVLSSNWLSLFFLFVGIIISLFGKEIFIYNKENAYHYPILLFILNFLLFFISCAVLYTDNRNPFIYFNF